LGDDFAAVGRYAEKRTPNAPSCECATTRKTFLEYTFHPPIILISPYLI